jgi:hypothetical protein
MIRSEVRDGLLFVLDQPVRTPYPVVGVIALEEIVIALLDDGGASDARNVIALSGAGELVWRVEEQTEGGGGTPSFVAMWRGEDGKVLARNWNGVEYMISPTDGSLTVVGLRRF